MEKKRTAIIIGAGPAGLTAAYELLKRTDIKPIVLEATGDIGGISRTANHKGNRIDIGGHRFFSKSKRVMDWWTKILPVQGKPSLDELLLELDVTRKYAQTSNGPDPEKTDLVMLLRNRVSRIFFLRKFFDYPISLNQGTFTNLGLPRVIRIGFSYLRARALPRRNVKSLEDFFVNRFGWELYRIFFKDYTEKVWGISCDQIKPEWGAQRIKGLSATRSAIHALKKLFRKSDSDIEQRSTETSLIEQFMYPKLGPGQLWEETARRITAMGGEIHKGAEVVEIGHTPGKILSVKIQSDTGLKEISADYFFSSMPVKDLIRGMGSTVPPEVAQVAQGLVYRDFMTVGLLLNKLKIKNEPPRKTLNGIVPDNWIYIQERDVRIGRLQIFNNWSPYLVQDKSKVWIGLEYFCNEGDELWAMEDAKFIDFAIDELVKIDVIDRQEVLDSCLLRVPKAYPAYFGSYDHFQTVRTFTDSFQNLFLIGRNGMHKYNNSDHSMLTAMVSVDNIASGIASKENIWAVNTEESYHEEECG